MGEGCIALKNYSTQSLDSSVWAGKNLLKEAVYFLERNAKNHSSLQLKTQASARQGDAYLSLLVFGRVAGALESETSLGNTVRLSLLKTKLINE